MFNRVVEFHKLNLEALQLIHITKFLAIKFFSITIALRCSNLGEWVDIRGLASASTKPYSVFISYQLFLYLTSPYSLSQVILTEFYKHIINLHS